jgi:4-amino-4-deoxy-L-arabinose transferase-like glycosyltransferase
LPSAAERWGLVVAAAYLVAALHGLGAADVVGDDEAREAGIVQDVVAGHWLWPRFNAELLPDKPILYHWLAAAPCALGGFSAVAVRLPSAVAGAALVAWTARFGATVLDGPGGVAAAIALATTPALFTHARVARPDVLLVLFLALALGAAFRWWRDGRRRDATAALAWLGLATFAKGPVGPALFVVVLGLFLAWERQLGRARQLLTVPGVIAFAVVGLGWYAVALAGWGDAFVREHLVGRYLRNLAGGLPSGNVYSPKPLAYHLLFYVKHLPLVALPWTPLAAVAVWRAWRTGGLRDPRLRFLVCWTIAPVVVFTPAEWKLRYYLLPSLPALALLAAPAGLALWRARPRPVDPRLLVGTGMLALLGVGGLSWLAWSGRAYLSRSDRTTLDALVAALPGGADGLVAIAGAAAGFVTVAVGMRAWGTLIGATAILTAVGMTVGTPALERAGSRRDSLRDFAVATSHRAGPDGRLVFFPETIRPIVVYAARRIPAVRRAADLPPDALVVAREGAYARLVRHGRAGPPLAVGHGRVGNVDRERVVLAPVRDAASLAPAARDAR